MEKRENSKGEITIMLKRRACNIYEDNKLWLHGTMKFKTSYKDKKHSLFKTVNRWNMGSRIVIMAYQHPFYFVRLPTKKVMLNSKPNSHLYRILPI